MGLIHPISLLLQPPYIFIDADGAAYPSCDDAALQRLSDARLCRMQFESTTRLGSCHLTTEYVRVFYIIVERSLNSSLLQTACLIARSSTCQSRLTIARRPQSACSTFLLNWTTEASHDSEWGSSSPPTAFCSHSRWYLYFHLYRHLHHRLQRQRGDERR